MAGVGTPAPRIDRYSRWLPFILRHVNDYVSLPTRWIFGVFFFCVKFTPRRRLLRRSRIMSVTSIHRCCYVTLAYPLTPRIERPVLSATILPLNIGRSRARRKEAPLQMSHPFTILWVLKIDRFQRVRGEMKYVTRKNIFYGRAFFHSEE